MSRAFIQDSPKFYGCFQVVVADVAYNPTRGVTTEVIDCANYATAVSVRDGINNGDGVPVALPKAVEPVPNLEQSGGCLTGGLGHTPAVTWLLTGRVEQVHNWATARSLKRDYPPCHALTAGHI